MTPVAPPSFKVGTKPQLSKEEFAAATERSGGKFLNTPGTFNLMVKSAKYGNVSEKDPAWMTAIFELEDPEGKTMNQYVMFPTECRNSFLYGERKSSLPLEQLIKFLRGFGVAFDYDNGMTQIASIFGNLDLFLTKTISVRCGYEGSYLKYDGKDEDGKNRYILSDKNGKALVDQVFPDVDAAKSAARDNKVTLGFLRILEVFGSTENKLLPTVTLVDSALPF